MKNLNELMNEDKLILDVSSFLGGNSVTAFSSVSDKF